MLLGFNMFDFWELHLNKLRRFKVVNVGYFPENGMSMLMACFTSVVIIYSGKSVSSFDVLRVILSKG